MNPLTLPENEIRQLLADAQPIIKRRWDSMCPADRIRIRDAIRAAEGRLPDYWQIVGRKPDGIDCISRNLGMSAILSGSLEDDGKLWLHFSLCLQGRKITPNWVQLVEAKNIFLGEDALAIQVFPRKSNYVNIHLFVLHLWTCLDGDPVPDFSSGSGTI